MSYAGIELNLFIYSMHSTMVYYLNSYLSMPDRNQTRMWEGGCGACTVMVSKYDHDNKQIQYPFYLSSVRQRSQGSDVYADFLSINFNIGCARLLEYSKNLS